MFVTVIINKPGLKIGEYIANIHICHTNDLKESSSTQLTTSID